MTEAPFAIEAGRWWGWQEVPAPHRGWGASPIFVTAVTPLKTGKGFLRLAFVHALRPVAAAARSVDLKLVHRGPGHVAGTFKAEDGTIRLAIVAAADFDWLRSFCTLLWQRRPPQMPTMLIDGKPLPGPSAQDYLAATLGRDAAAVERGATAASFGCEKRPMPDRVARFALDLTLDPFDSWLAARGVVPAEMEDKWFVTYEAGRLLFRRSWTGNLIWDVATDWRGDSLHLGEAVANRDPGQYGETDDGHDRRMLLYVIGAVLLNVPAAFPAKGDAAPGENAIKAWSVAGKASL